MAGGIRVSKFEEEFNEGSAVYEGRMLKKAKESGAENDSFTARALHHFDLTKWATWNDDPDGKKLTLAERIKISAALVQDALNGTVSGVANKGKSQFRAYKLRRNLEPFRWMTSIFLLILTLVENPSWCYNDSDKCMDPKYAADQFRHLNNYAALCIEISLLGFLGFCLLLELYYMDPQRLPGNVVLFGTNRAPKPIWALASAVLVAIGILDAGLSFPLSSRTVRVSPYVRPWLFVAFSRRVRSSFASMMYSIPTVMEVLALEVLLLCAYSWFGILQWHNSAQGLQYFPEFRTTLVNMQILLTSANFPDVMMPAYNESRFAIFFFGSFVCLGMWALQPIVLAGMADNFTKYEEKERIRFEDARAVSLRAAYCVLNPDRSNKVPEDTIKKLLEEVRQYNATTGMLSTSAIEKSIVRLDANRDGVVSKREFLDLATILQADGSAKSQGSNVTKPGDACLLTLLFAPLRGSDTILQAQTLVLDPRFTRFFDALSVGSLVLIAVETHAVLEGWHEESMWIWSHYAVSGIFGIEFLCLLLLHRPTDVISDFRAALDSATAVASIVLCATGASEHMIRQIHLLRLGRVSTFLRPFRRVFATLFKLGPAIASMFGVVVLVFFVFGLLGMDMFGGLLVLDDEQLSGSAFAESHYWSNNFNSFLAAAGTLFELTVGNNWFVIQDVYVDLTGNWSRFFFLFFYVFSNMFVLNLLLAVVLNAFLEEWTTGDEVEELGNTNGSTGSSAPAPKKKQRRKKRCCHPNAVAPETVPVAPPVSIASAVAALPGRKSSPPTSNSVEDPRRPSPVSRSISPNDSGLARAAPAVNGGGDLDMDSDVIEL